jgi:hypothetical protein
MLVSRQGPPLRTLPVPDPQRMTLLSTSTSTSYLAPYNYATLDEIRRRHLVESAAAAMPCCGNPTVTIAGEAQAPGDVCVSMTLAQS